MPYEDLYSKFVEKLPLLNELSETPQDPEWHGEGDVETHTRMVLSELEAVLENVDFEVDRDALRLAAFFHDMGKARRTRKSEDGRIISPGHAILGRSILGREMHEEWEPEKWWKILQLVGYHHKPARFVDEDDRSIRYLSRLVNPKEMYCLEKADIRGRESDDKKEGLEKVELYRMMSEEVGVWNDRDGFSSWDENIRQELKDYPEKTVDFVRAEARFAADEGNIYHWEEALSQSYQYRENHPHLIILCGPSGSGKSTLSESSPSDEVVSLDRIRDSVGDSEEDFSNEGKVRQKSKQELKSHLADNKSVVWDATNYRKDFRKPLVQIGYQYGALVSMKVLCTPRKVCKERSNAPDRIIDQQFDKWQFPESDECHRVTYLNRDGEKIVRCIGGFEDF